MFEENFINLSNSDKEDFRATVNHLMSHSFIVRDIFDPKEKIIKINPFYRYCERKFELIDEYLSYTGFTITKDIILGVIVLSNIDGENRIKIDRESSLILYVLRLIFENEKGESNQSSQGVYITTTTLCKTMLDLGVSLNAKKLTARGVSKPLKFLAKYNLINKVSGRYDEGTASFYILPSICYAVDNNKIQVMSDMIDRIKEEKNSINLEDMKGDFN